MHAGNFSTYEQTSSGNYMVHCVKFQVIDFFQQNITPYLIHFSIHINDTLNMPLWSKQSLYNAFDVSKDSSKTKIVCTNETI